METLASLLPFAILCLAFFVFAIPICKRKGKSIGFALFCLIPLVGPFVLLYVASLTDRSVLERLSAIESNRRLQVAT
jgi:hypothetical protein